VLFDTGQGKVLLGNAEELEWNQRSKSKSCCTLP
jgi:metal-dependent hydrolase (beta-lactamase superfamily II)